MSSSVQSYTVRPGLRGRVIGLGLGRSRFVGSGVGLLLGACLAGGLVGTLAAPAMAGPEGAQVRAGDVKIIQRGNTTVIRASDRSIIDYSRFDVSKGERVRFVQPGASATVLNRITSDVPTMIDGSVRSNGIVYFANRAGVVFGPSAVLDVGGLYAAAGNISNDDFLRGMNRFTEVDGSVVNQGVVDAKFAALIGRTVANAGVISAPGGTVAMVAGRDVILTERGGNLSVKVDAEALGLETGGAGTKAGAGAISGPGVENTGVINAGRGRAMMVAGDLYSLAVRNSGTVRGGQIEIAGRGSGKVEVSGRLSARSTGPRLMGGEVTITGAEIDVRGASIDASGARGGGRVRIGGDYLGGAGLESPIRNAANTSVDAGTSIAADGLKNGDGGTIVVWSDNRTNFYGTATARGGVLGGDGGLIETSGKITLDVKNAVVRASSRAGGVAGLWLLDPVNVNIDAAPGAGAPSSSGGGTTTFTPDASVTPAIVDVASVIAALESGTNVTITTGLAGSPGAQAGNIAVNAPIALSNAPGGTPDNAVPTLRLIANNNIDVNQAISTGGAALPLSVSLQAGNAVTVAAGVTTGGGSFGASGVNFTNTAGITTAGGAVTLDMTGNISVESAINASGAGGTGAVRFTAATIDNIIAGVTSGSGGIVLEPSTAGASVRINSAGSGFSISQTELALLTAPSGATVRIGRTDGTHAVTIGAFDVSGLAANLLIRGGALTLEGAAIGPAGARLSLIGASLTDSNAVGTDITVAGGTLTFDVDGSVGSSGTALRTNVAALSGTDVGGGLFVDNAANLTVNGALDVDGDLRLRTDGSIGGTGIWTVGGSTELITRADAGASIFLPNTNNTFTGPVTLRSRQLTDDSLLGAGSITLSVFGDLTLGQVENAGAAQVTIIHASDLSQAAGANLVFGSGGLSLVNTASSNTINLPRLVAGGAITLAAGSSGTNVSLTTLSSSTAGLSLNAGAAVGGSLSLRSGFGGITVPTMTVGGPVSLISTATDANISAGTITGTTSFTLATAGTGDATLNTPGAATINANIGGGLFGSFGGNLNVLSSSTLNLGTIGVTGTATFNGPDIEVLAPVTADNINLIPDTDARTVGLGNTVGDFRLDQFDLANLNTTGLVIIGRSTGTGLITISSGFGLDLSSTGYDLRIRGGAVDFDGTLFLSAGSRLTFQAGAIQGQVISSPITGMGAPLTPDVVIAGAGELVIQATGDVDMTSSVDRVAAAVTGGSLRLENDRALTIEAIGGITGVSTTGAGGIRVVAAGLLNINQNVSTDAANIVRLVSSTDSIGFNGSAGVSGGAVTLSALSSIFGNGSSDVRVAGSSITLNATNGAVGVGAPLRTATTGLITINAPAFIDLINTGNASLTFNTGGLATIANTGTLTFASAPSTAARVNLSSTGSLIINQNLTATGPGSSTLSTSGALIVASGATVETGNQPLTITAEDLDLAGAIRAGQLFIDRASIGSIGVGDAAGDLSVSKAELARISAIALTLGGSNTNLITVTNVAAADVADIGEFILDAAAPGGDVTFAGQASAFERLTVTAADTVTVGVNLSTTQGTLSLTAAADATPDTGGDRVNIGSGVTIAAGGATSDLLINAPTISGAGSFTGTAGRDLTITGDTLSTVANLSLTAGRDLTINAAASGQNIALSAADDVLVNALTSTPGAGGSTGTPTTIAADSDNSGAGTFTLASGRTITTNNAALTITGADVALDGDINAGTGAVTIGRSSSGSIGLGTASGDLSLSGAELDRVTAATLTLGNAATALMNIAGVGPSDTAGIGTGITLVADDMDVTGGFNASTAALTIGRATNGFVTLGSASGGLSLSAAELANFTAPSLTIGGAQVGNILVAALGGAATDNIAGTVTLNSTGTITFTTGQSTFKTLVAGANNGINVSQNLTTTVGDLTLNGDADNLLGSQDGVNVGFNRTIQSAGKLTLRATNGGASSTSGATLRANSGIDLLDGFGASGLLTINADNDASGGGTLLVSTGRTITTGSNNLSITAADLTLDGSIDTGSGAVLITRSAPGTIGIGTAGGDLTISGPELQRITGTNVGFGTGATGNVTVAGVTAAQSNNLAGVTSIEAGTGGALTFDSANTFNAINGLAGTTITVNGALTTDVGALSLSPNRALGPAATNVVRLNANLTAPNTQDVTINGNVVLGANVTIVGNDLSLSSPIDSDATARSLTLNSFTGGVTRLGSVGTTSRLFTLTTNADGRTVLGGTYQTTGTVQLLDSVRLSADTRIETQGGLGVTFGRTVNSSNNTPRALTVLTRRNTSSTVKRIPLITFAGAVGARRALSDIFLNYDPSAPSSVRANVPAVATIVARPLDAGGLPVASPTSNLNMSFRSTGQFRMGRNEKFSTLGSLTINAASATLSDLNTLGDMTVNAPSITLQLRPGSRVLGSLVTTANPSGLSVTPDRGVDFVAGGRITFSSAPTTSGTGEIPSFGSTNGAADMSPTLAAFLRQQYGELTRAEFSRIETSGSTTLPPITLDLISSGPTDAPLATTLAGAIPRESRVAVVGQDTTIAQAQIEELRNLGVFARNPSADELISLLGGAATYDDVPRKSLPTASDYTTVVSRLPADRVDALLRTYDRVFNKTSTDEQGNTVRANRSAEIQAALLASVRRFRAARAGSTDPAPAGAAPGADAPAPRASSFDPIAFRTFLETSPEETVSLGYIRELEEFLIELDSVGLTPRELAQSKAAILNPVRPRGIPTVQMLEAVIRGKQVSMNR